MSDDNEIEFESDDSGNWAIVKAGATTLAQTNLQKRFNAAASAAEGFKSDAHRLLDEAITKPPGSLLSFGAIADLVVAACWIVLPEEGVIALVFEEAKQAWEAVKPSYELARKATEPFEANTVEAAKEHLSELYDMLAAEIASNALTITSSAQNKVGDALNEYVKQNPQVFPMIQDQDQAYYQTLCDAIGVTAPNVESLQDEIITKVMTTFRESVNWTVAHMHFMEMSDDLERLNFLIDDIAEKGTDPDDFLKGIGGDVDYWDQFLSIYRSDGKHAAMVALGSRLGMPEWTLAARGF